VFRDLAHVSCVRGSGGRAGFVAHGAGHCGVSLHHDPDGRPANQVPGIDAVREHRGFDYVYRYEAGGEMRYQCIRWFGQGTASGNNSDAEIDREFPRGQPLKVHYNPEDPDTAVLSPGVRPFAWILPGAGVGFMLFGGLGILVGTRR
jgi:hypothetical protein